MIESKGDLAQASTSEEVPEEVILSWGLKDKQALTKIKEGVLEGATWARLLGSYGDDFKQTAGKVNRTLLFHKKRWQEYTEELYKKDLHDPDNHDGMITHLEPDILECEVKWAL